MVSFPNAKINIGLNIIEKRTDGFHNIESVFYPVGWADALEIIPSDIFKLEFSGLNIPGNQNHNLVLKALQLLEEYSHRSLSSLLIHLHKVIPMGAGLGGGSADGAFALKMLNELFDLNFSHEVLISLAQQLGSDCAFFIENKPAFCFEKGDKFEKTTVNLTKKYIYLVNPSIHISTAEAYAGVRPMPWQVSLKEALLYPIEEWKNLVKNDFEASLLSRYPKIDLIKHELYKQGAVYASMTGSGSTVYGIFNEKPKTDLEFENCIVWHGALT